MKAILEFDLPEDEYQHTCAVRAQDLNLALYDIDQLLRSKLKYEDGKVTPEFLEDLRMRIQTVIVEE